jgi:hypothetical protein
MGVLKTFAVVGIALAVVGNAPEIAGWARTEAVDLVAPEPAPDAYSRLCPMLDAYFSVDATGQKALSAGIGALANEGQASDDPAVRAFSQTVPVALTGRGKARTAARALVARECRANGHTAR